MLLYIVVQMAALAQGSKVVESVVGFISINVRYG
jgi:hypothetical protein